MATEYSDDSECSESEDEKIEAVLKGAPKLEACPVKTKRAYNRKVPLSDKQKEAIVDKLAKARKARVISQNAKKLSKAQEEADLKHLKKLKDSGEIKITKPKAEKAKKQVVVKEIHHYHGAPQEDDAPVPKPAKVKKTSPPPPEPATPRVARPAVPKMVFA